MMSLPRNPQAAQNPRRSRRPLELQEILQSLRLVLEMEPDHLDGAIDLLDEAIDIDQRKSGRVYSGRLG
jgi:hypothetical protein